MALFRRDTDLDDHHGDERPFWAKPGFVFAAVVVVAVVLLGVILAFTAGGDDEPAEAQRQEPDTASVSPEPEGATQTTGSAEPPAADTAPGTEDCPDLSGRGGDDAITQAPEVQWSPVGEVAAAYSENNGPADLEGVSRCFAQTPEGALLAAYNFLAEVRTSTLDPRTVVEMRMDHQAPGYSTLLAQAAEPGSNPPISIVGYRFVQSAESQHTIALVQRLPGSSTALYAQDRVTVEWGGSDWYVTAVEDPEQVDGLPPGFVEWGPDIGDLE